MTNEVDLPDRYAKMNEIVALYIKGATIPTIMRKMSMKRVEVLDYIDEYKQVIRSDPQTKDRAQETLSNFDAHTSEIIREMWELYESTTDSKTQAGILKSLADVDKARVETLQKAGLYDDAALGDEMAKTQEQAQAIKELLKNIVTQYPETKNAILSGLNKIFNDSSGVEVDPIQGTIVPPEAPDA